MILYLVRHAEPSISEYKGFPGPELGDSGKRQALKIADYLKDKPVNRILTSDYTRVLQTVTPYRELTKHPVEKLKILREREKQSETHEELVKRIYMWFNLFLQKEDKNTAIFSHCGPINMILFYLDNNLKIMNYPYVCEYQCFTPKGGVWELYIENQELIKGELKIRG